MATIGDTVNRLLNQEDRGEVLTQAEIKAGFAKATGMTPGMEITFDVPSKEDNRTACFVFLFDMLVEEGVEAKEAAELALRVIGGYGLS